MASGTMKFILGASSGLTQCRRFKNVTLSDPYEPDPQVGDNLHELDDAVDAPNKSFFLCGVVLVWFACGLVFCVRRCCIGCTINSGPRSIFVANSKRLICSFAQYSILCHGLVSFLFLSLPGLS